MSEFEGFRESLPTHTEQERAGKFFCKRCQREHWRIGFTREDYDGYVSHAAKRLSDAIDAQALESVQALIKET